MNTTAKQQQNIPQERALATPRAQVAVAQQTPAGGGLAAMFTPNTREEAMKLCHDISRESWVNSCFQNNPMFVAIALDYGQRFGLSHIASLTNISVINGKPSIYGDMLMAVCRTADPNMRYTEEVHYSSDDPKKRVPVGATVTVQRGGEGDTYTESFMRADADRAGLTNKKGPWTTHPARMYMFRARGYVLRTAYPDVLMGFITDDEARDYPSREERAAERRQRRVSPHPTKVMDAHTLPAAAPAAQADTDGSQVAENDEPQDVEPVSLDEFLGAVAMANSVKELTQAIGPRGKGLPEADRAPAGRAYSDRRKVLQEQERQITNAVQAQSINRDPGTSHNDGIFDTGEDLPGVDQIPSPEQVLRGVQ